MCDLLKKLISLTADYKSCYQTFETIFFKCFIGKFIGSKVI